MTSFPAISGWRAEIATVATVYNLRIFNRQNARLAHRQNVYVPIGLIASSAFIDRRYRKPLPIIAGRPFWPPVHEQTVAKIAALQLIAWNEWQINPLAATCRICYLICNRQSGSDQ